MALMVCDEDKSKSTINNIICINKKQLFYGKIIILMCVFYTVIGEQTIDLPKKNVYLTTTKPSELDSSDGCAACEAFMTVFEDRLTNDSVSVDDIDLIELCNEVEIAYKDQVNTTILVFLDCIKQIMCNYYQM